MNLKTIGLTRIKQLFPRSKILYERFKKLKKMLHKRQIRSHKRDFVLSQNRNQKRKSRGRRFTLDDKIFALSIYKQSGKGYRFLSKIFSLPSRKTLVKVLRKIPFHFGINPDIFNHLNERVRKLTVLDRNCGLMFDEIALQLGLQYNYKLDCVDGFVDLGGSDRRAKFADHALVFLIKGIRKKWRQPICFTFCEGTTKTAALVNLIKYVVRSVCETGLTIVATVSDQGATNASAIRSLINHTQSYCIRKEVNNRYQGYLVDEMEIVHLYDVPHLFTGLRNGLLKSDLHFIEDGVQKLASWNHLITLYELDSKMGRFSQHIKLTDEHVLPEQI
ncbi:hypothetical protein HUJ04_011049 [Dendroctonus ponderosae]|nr:hypothetical protein HUJ04_011049 [Dendroctonus ponderosae]